MHKGKGGIYTNIYIDIEIYRERKRAKQMETITICNRKGGTGKTVTALNLGASLRAEGYKVLYVDLDSQRNLTRTLTAQECKQNSFSLLVKETENAKSCIIETSEGDLIPGAEQLASVDRLGIGLDVLKNALTPVKKKYDYIIIDTPAVNSLCVINAFICSNSLIIPVQADLYSLYALEDEYKVIDQIRKKYNRFLKIQGILLTRYQANAKLSKLIKESFEEEAKELGTRLFDTVIRENITIKESLLYCKSVINYKPKSNGAKDYRSFTVEYLKRKGQ